MLPLWSAAVDPRVLTVRAFQSSPGHARLFEAQSAMVCTVQGTHCEHLVIDSGGEAIRLDVVEGTMAVGPVILRFDVCDDDRLDMQLSALRVFREPVTAVRPQVQLARRLLALQALDARDAGISLREIADLLLGAGEWPGDGEHRKSRVRRLIDIGKRMVIAGPRTILAGA